MFVKVTKCFDDKVIVKNFNEKIVAINFNEKINDKVNIFVKIEKNCDETLKINFLT